ncbi:hypothetical protein SARC_09308 [Sphaeroforma arctica JP610]|uniref:EamA domain-containing protein n=1 Tax=Sphaeroforma arctica JP610 TaxID=667725 RepID=A0A0L0FN81_9EUKA|nr:hypothetical protein SARC_09308 [Sphaeroforma arctica JP610]KNC78250.1 hypothetical protein SARC_09308 [Sphaeroforma arctica JP610]|eukprot:XP_014152152.1 hypothetical protein SARC_09308 [Sphaeroforma arctica JP610]
MTAGWVFAVVAGSCAALSSTFMKLVSDATFNSSVTTAGNNAGTFLEGILYPHTVGVLINIAFIFVTQSLMWFYFSKSLVYCDSALEATVINTACNFSVSALLGSVLFGEELTLQWCFGLSLILAGVLLIVRQTTLPNMEKPELKKE